MRYRCGDKLDAYEKEFERFKKELIDGFNGRFGASRIIQNAFELKNDIEFVTQFANRFKTTFFSLKIITTYENRIIGNFVEDLFRAVSPKTQEDYEKFFWLYEITKNVMNDVVIDDEDMRDVLRWQQVLYAYTSLKLKDYIESFCGCNSTLKGIYKKWMKVEDEMSEADYGLKVLI